MAEADVEKKSVEKYVNVVDRSIGKALGLVENHPWESWLTSVNALVVRVVPLFIAVAAVLGFLVGLILAIKYDMPISRVFSIMVILLVGLLAMHLSPKTIGLSSSLLSKREEDAVRPELLYILKVLLSFGGLCFGIYLLFQFSGITTVFALCAFLIAFLALVLLSHPAIIGTKADYPTNVVEEGCALVLIPLKIVLALLPLLLGIGCVVGLVMGVVKMFSNGAMALSVFVGTVLLPFFLPLIVYYCFLTLVGFIDFISGIASIPRKLDEVKKAFGER